MGFFRYGRGGREGSGGASLSVIHFRCVVFLVCVPLPHVRRSRALLLGSWLLRAWGPCSSLSLWLLSPLAPCVGVCVPSIAASMLVSYEHSSASVGIRGCRAAGVGSCGEAWEAQSSALSRAHPLSPRTLVHVRRRLVSQHHQAVRVLCKRCLLDRCHPRERGPGLRRERERVVDQWLRGGSGCGPGCPLRRRHHACVRTRRMECSAW